MNGNDMLSDRELLFSLHRQADRDEELALTDAEVAAQLTKAGFERGEIRAEAEALSRSPRDFLAALHRQADRDEELALTDAQIAAELAMAGITQGELDAQRTELRDKLAGPKVAKSTNGTARVVSLPPPRRKVPRLAYLAAAAVMVAAGAYAARTRIVRIIAPERAQVGPAPTSPKALAEQLRDQAFDKCHNMQWRECSGLLDQASKMDPKGEMEPRVHTARMAIQWALTHDPNQPWYDIKSGRPIPPPHGKPPPPE